MGGASVSNPFSWRVCSLSLKFPEVVSGGVSEEDEHDYKPKPIIEVSGCGLWAGPANDVKKSNS